jgi:hypothetical protein|eukprot:COSAG06_NODE_3737_length_4958_cov_13.429718_3_plen_105_part_00
MALTKSTGVVALVSTAIQNVEFKGIVCCRHRRVVVPAIFAIWALIRRATWLHLLYLIAAAEKAIVRKLMHSVVRVRVAYSTPMNPRCVRTLPLCDIIYLISQHT